MAKSQNQKLKLLYIRDFLLEKTDESHVVTVNDIISHLDAYGISAERKSIYDDIETLRLYGLDIIQVRSKKTGYYVANRDFELPELKLLVDAVQSSKFITHKKSLALIKKIEGLASAYDAQKLHRQVYVTNRVKVQNESVYYNVDIIHDAIVQDRKILFKYFDYSVRKEQIFRHDGGDYKISPFALTWDDENYYMLGFDSDAGKLKHYRVDRMKRLSVTDEPRDGKEQFRSLDMAVYSKKVFGMFSGEERVVKLKFANHLVGAVIDRFGKDVQIIESGNDSFIVNVNVDVSPQFFGWLNGFGADVTILAPNDVVRQMKNHVTAIAELYK